MLILNIETHIMEKENTFKSLIDTLGPRAERTILESPLELMFIETLEKYLSPKVKIIPQYEVKTICGNFRLDFLLEVDGKKIAFECDGKEFHNELNDEWRDALILGNREIDSIYRFRGKDLHTFLNDCIFMIYYYDNELFSERYFPNHTQLISDNLKNWFTNRVFNDSERNYIDYPVIALDGTKVGELSLLIQRKNVNDTKSRWNELYRFAEKHPGKSIIELIKLKRIAN